MLTVLVRSMTRKSRKVVFLLKFMKITEIHEKGCITAGFKTRKLGIKHGFSHKPGLGLKQGILNTDFMTFPDIKHGFYDFSRILQN